MNYPYMIRVSDKTGGEAMVRMSDGIIIHHRLTLFDTYKHAKTYFDRLVGLKIPNIKVTLLKRHYRYSNHIWYEQHQLLNEYMS